MYSETTEHQATGTIAQAEDLHDKLSAAFRPLLVRLHRQICDLHPNNETQRQLADQLLDDVNAMTRALQQWEQKRMDYEAPF